MHAITHLDKPACAAPDLLPLVDAAFERPGGPEAQRMKRDLCTGCPVGDQCLAFAMTSHQYGVWGGTSSNARTRHGAPPSTNHAAVLRRQAS
jgi:hypothetical protein